MLKVPVRTLLPFCLLLVLTLPPTTLFAEEATIHRGNVGGYTAARPAAALKAAAVWPEGNLPQRLAIHGASGGRGRNPFGPGRPATGLRMMML